MPQFAAILTAMRRLVLLILLVVFASLPVRAEEEAPQLPTLSVKDQKDVERIEAYLNTLKSISANFLQVDDHGSIMTGSIAIWRPGRMRVTYDPPSKDFIVADGRMVHIWDDELKSQTNVDQDASLANFILRDPIKLSGDVMVTKIARSPAKLEVSLVQVDDPGQGTLTLVFEDKPLKLRQWKVLDPQGRTTGVNLENTQEDVGFSKKLFEFVPPNFGLNKKSAAP